MSGRGEATESRRAALIVHWREHVEAALAAASDANQHVLLVSSPGAGASLGPLAWQAMLRQAAAAYPTARFVAYLDCADEEGTVLKALRAGVTHVRYCGAADAADRLAAIAEQSGAELTTDDFEGFDLLGQPDPFAACRAWIWRKSTL